MSYKHIEVKQVAGFIGAKISGVDLSNPLSDEAIQEIRQSLHKLQVLKNPTAFTRGILL